MSEATTAATPVAVKKSRVSDVDFVQAYTKCKSSEELSEMTGLTIESARSRAAKLRKAGVMLPAFNRKRTVDVAGLNAILGENVSD
jgi:hypothetical protein